jgi:GNAT superfamily N-acetyltransferase/predicted transcriptional regulator
MSEFRLDRILDEDEVAQLNDLLVSKLRNDYPNFEGWLKKAQEEILEGTRIAIGIWKEKLIASSIVKLTASRTAELKSFFVDSDFRDQGYGNQLFEETEMQCRKAGVVRVITDTYAENTSSVEFFISKGFLVSGREDLYGNGKYSYILSKTLAPEYFGDPYDWEELGEWYLRTRLNATNIENHPVVNNRKFDRHMRIIIGAYPLEALVEIKDQKVDMDDVEILHKKCTESDYHLAVFVAREFTHRATDYAHQHGVIIFDSKDIARTLGKDPVTFREDPIIGMVVAVKPKYLREILKRKLPVYYVKGGPTGKFLDKGHIIIFYTMAPEKNVTTIGKVDSVELGSPSAVWELISNNTVFTEKEFFRFASIKERILAIKLSDIWQISPIEEEELDKIIPSKDRNGSYIDAKTRDIILSRKRVAMIP